MSSTAPNEFVRPSVIALGQRPIIQRPLMGRIWRGTFVNPPSPSTTPGAIGGWTAVYRAGTPGDTPARLTDYSGNGYHATQPAVANRYELLPSINGLSSFHEKTLTGTFNWFILPSGLAIDRQSHGIYFVGRTRSQINSTTRPLYSFGPAVSSLMTEFSPLGANQVNTLRLWGNAVQQLAGATIIGRSGLTILAVSASAGSVVVRLNGIQVTLAAFAAGVLTGGILGKRTDNIDWAGEIYEFGVLPRPFTVGDMAALEADAILRYGRALSPSKEIVLQGDSLTDGFMTDPGAGWPWLLDNALGASWRQLSMGQYGDTVQTMALRAPSLGSTFDAAKTKHVAVLAGGTNDLAVNNRTATQVLADAQTCVTALIGPGFAPLVCTVAARGDAAWTPQMETYRLAYNAGLPGLAGIAGVVDLASLPALANPNDPTFFYPDKIHWTNATHAAVSTLVQAAVLAL